MHECQNVFHEIGFAVGLCPILKDNDPNNRVTDEIIQTDLLLEEKEIEKYYYKYLALLHDVVISGIPNVLRLCQSLFYGLDELLWKIYEKEKGEQTDLDKEWADSWNHLHLHEIIQSCREDDQQEDSLYNHFINHLFQGRAYYGIHDVQRKITTLPVEQATK